MNNWIIKITVVVAYIGMVFVNYLANALPINGLDTGTISDSYPNLFAPAGITFAIWGLIYILLGAFTIYQLGPFKNSQPQINPEALNKIRWLFIITSVANISWIFAWHYLVIWLSLILMTVLLVGLIKTANTIKSQKLCRAENWFVRIPFSVYFGWITVATIANVTIFLVSIDWNGFGLPDQLWAVIVILIGAAIGLWRMLKDNNIAYGLVLVWAYIGIIIKHVTTTGFDWAYPTVVYITAVCILMYVGALIKIVGRPQQNTIN